MPTLDEPRTSLPLLSYTQINRYNKCQALWEYAYKHGKHVPGSKATMLGTYIHTNLELTYQWQIDHNEGLFAPIPAMDRAIMFNPTPQEMADDFQASQLMVQAATVVNDYHDLAMPHYDRHLRVLAVEERIVVPFRTPGGIDVMVEMYIDLLGMNLASGVLQGFDHKSGKIYTRDELEWMLQFHMYMYFMRQHGYHIQEFVCNNLSTWTWTPRSRVAKRVSERFVRLDPIKYSEAKAEAALENLGKIIDEMFNDQPKYMQYDATCTNCAFRNVCELRLQGKTDEASQLLALYDDKKASLDIRRGEKLELQATLDTRRMMAQAPVEVQTYEFDED